ncbi:hypothetical protein HY970_00705 [Candidatus Kaiserbacteria bacterium]|nr:hypothetical protein [Candidatus Kaiserbacteria bacterium]
MSSRTGNLFTINPRLNADGEIVYDNFDVNNMWQAQDHKVRMWQPRDKEGKVTGPTHLATILGTEEGGLVARGYEALEVADPERKVKLLTDRSMLADVGTYTIDGDGMPQLTVWADDRFYYVKMHTGLVHTRVTFVDPETGRERKRLWAAHDMLEIVRRKMDFVDHGFHSLGGANALRDNAVSVDLADDQTGVIWSTASRSKIYGTKIPEWRDTLFRVDRRGGEGALQNIGMFLHFKGTPDELLITDAHDRTDLQEIWRREEQRRLDLLKASRAVRRLIKDGKMGQADPIAEVTEEVAPTLPVAAA